ncbi:hypothetical protein BOSEA31B_11353 [Hyphomicrobiales bacterium]|nr:hypothetical protein BOSEA31B_11353 [Hyphomicrobiales bacterium]CAH1697146.1 hypothetical protein BOSEA1005_10183 [Hyphomicrobiales bacterium]CAI0342714.1 hypothetical protein BO1005MUT1_10007 [Hyphomicrobiales bacterium]
MNVAANPPECREARANPLVRRRFALIADLADAPDETLLSPAEATALSGIAQVTWRAWRQASRGPSWLLVEGMPRLSLGEYRRWLAAQPSA